MENKYFYCMECGAQHRVELLHGKPSGAILSPQFEVEDIIDQLPHGTHFQTLTKKLLGITLHQSATKTTAAGSNPFGYAAYHTRNLCWNNIAYHRVVQPDGTIYKTNKITHKGNHAGTRLRPGDENRQFLGICFSGNFDKERISEVQYKAGLFAIVDLYREGKDAGLMPEPDDLTINGHEDMNYHKSCPGRLFPKAKMIEEALTIIKQGV